MPASIQAHLVTTPDSTSLDSLAILANRALETDVKDSSVGVAEVRVSDNERLIGIMEDISSRLKKLETAGTQKKQFNDKQQIDNRSHRTSNKQTFLPNANTRPFTPRIAKTNNNGNNNGQNVFPTNRPAPRPTAPPPYLPQNPYRTANGHGRCTDLLLSSATIIRDLVIRRVSAETPARLL